MSKKASNPPPPVGVKPLPPPPPKPITDYKVVLITKSGKVIKIPLSEIKTQHKGGGGSEIMRLAIEDEIVSAFCVKESGANL